MRIGSILTSTQWCSVTTACAGAFGANCSLQAVTQREYNGIDPAIDLLQIKVLVDVPRSAMMANFLTSVKDFSRVHNVTGGIDAYSRVDSSVPRY